MRELFSRETLTDIHIRLDRDGLQGITDKEISVLLSEAIYTSSTFVVEQLTERLNAQTQQLTVHAEKQTDRIVQELQSARGEIVQELQSVRGEIVQELQSVRGEIVEELQSIRGEIGQQLQSISGNLAYSRLWTKIIGVGLWAIAASLIANLLFQMLTKN